MYVNRYVTGYPVGLPTDSRVIVVDVSREGRIKVDREDGRAAGLWCDRDALRFPGESAEVRAAEAVTGHSPRCASQPKTGG